MIAGLVREWTPKATSVPSRNMSATVAVCGRANGASLWSPLELKRHMGWMRVLT